MTAMTRSAGVMLFMGLALMCANSAQAQSLKKVIVKSGAGVFGIDNTGQVFVISTK